MSMPEDNYPCVGICMDDPDFGYCLGCGRPPLPLSIKNEEIVADGAHEEARLVLVSSELNPRKADNHGEKQ